LNQLVRRLRGFRLARETIRKILLRHGDAIAELRRERGRPRRRIRVTRPRELWGADLTLDRKSTRLNSSHVKISYAVCCLKRKSGESGYRRLNPDIQRRLHRDAWERSV